tara:strand:- start:547 stop:987 length:441 start_codon:yes stop_codon:yes gene_type:complete
MTLFDWVNQVTLHKKSWDSFNESEQKLFQPYMINRFLSMNSAWTDLVNDLQPYTIGLLSSRDVYKLYCDIIPKGKVFLRYVKGKKDGKYEDWVVELLCEYYSVSKKEAIEYLDILYLSKEGKLHVKDILEKYGTEPKKIKKLKLEK